MRLYIIGNGFDKNHGLETGYYDYRDFLLSKYYEIYNTFQNFEYVALTTNDRWSNLEETLTFDYEAFMGNIIRVYYPDIMSDGDARWHRIVV